MVSTLFPPHILAGTVEAARLSLPHGDEGKKARGWVMLKSNEAAPIESGGRFSRFSKLHEQAETYLQKLFGADFRKYRLLARHMEIKAAVHMLCSASKDGKHRVIVIDREVCGRTQPTTTGESCHKLLNLLLRGTGYRLTVVERTGYAITYPLDKEEIS